MNIVRMTTPDNFISGKAAMPMTMAIAKSKVQRRILLVGDPLSCLVGTWWAYHCMPA